MYGNGTPAKRVSPRSLRVSASVPEDPQAGLVLADLAPYETLGRTVSKKGSCF
ncbi:predicted protein [Pyrenophora tritici-repentis Pt-1C-BFP]|uniref:Uncharacterized protein n=1 Tax=Pyrenophora tritici-repentis (strain Pt-1C-BFP) TaxID=426418 RepID=B2WKM8_PYRTR|nr:uncharacterized protein PTRG_10538 [Pyrenophora tritici-repentis Pt-1C-BFP]EDU43588.1 predicted protein [Pyrenophora tritici-repentis Pt-1C-BFP]